MEVFRQWALGLTAAVLAGAVVRIAAPEGAIDKAIKTVISVFIVFTLVIPFSGAGFSLNTPTLPQVPEYDDTALSETVWKQLLSAAETETEKKISEALGISENKVEVTAAKTDTGSIYIESAEIDVSDSPSINASQAESIVREIIGENAALLIG